MLASRLVSACLLFVVLAPPAPLSAQELTSPRLDQLRAEAQALSREAAALPNLNELRGDLFVHDERNRRIDLAIEVAKGTTEELEAYRVGEEARRIFTRDDAYDEIYQDKWEFVLEGILVTAGYKVAAAIGGGVTLFADVAGPLYKKYIKERDLAAFTQLIAEHKIRIEDFYALKIAVDLDRAETLAQIREVEAKRAEWRQKMAEIETELAHLRQAAEAEDEAADPFRLADLANLTKDTTSLEGAIILVEGATGLQVEDWRWHFSAKQTVENVIYYCPPYNGINADVDGTDRYYVGSGLCRSAVHAGIITEAGGFVRVRHFPADSSWKPVGSTRNGITSGTYNWRQSTFSFVPVLQ
jgi:hypothetical protein